MASAHMHLTSRMCCSRKGLEFSALDHEIEITDEQAATGRITYYYEGQNVGSADVTLTPEYIEETTGHTDQMEPSDENGNTADADEAGGFHIPGWLIRYWLWL